MAWRPAARSFGEGFERLGSRSGRHFEMTTDGRYWPDEFFEELARLDPGEIGHSDLRDDRLREMLRRSALEITAPDLANPARALMEERAERAGFEALLAARWGSGLDLFDLAVDHAVQCGRWINDTYRADAAARQSQRFEALVRLHGRAVMTAREVGVLLRSGYSTGALSRWRTAHELWVVFSLLHDGDEELSRRYLVHEAIESMKAQEDYEDTWEALGFAPPTSLASDRDRDRTMLRGEFGDAFLRDYGWAAPLFADRAPKFRQLQELAELDHWRGFYRMASHGTHANPKGASWSIQVISDSNVVLAGPSDAGLSDPAQCTLIALSNVTIGLLVYAVKHSQAAGSVEDHCLALVHQEAALLLQKRAIEHLAATSAEQVAEAETLTDLINRSRTVLSEDRGLTADEVADLLEADPEDVRGALERAVVRGTVQASMSFLATRTATEPG